MRKIFEIYLLALFLIPPFVSGCDSGRDSGPINNVPLSVKENASRLVSALLSDGFEVSRGYCKLMTADDCAVTYETMRNCYGNNPAAPYVSFVMPPWPEEYIDPATRYAIGKVREGYEGIFRMDPREAIVILGVLPPPAAYMGIQTYLFSREGTFDTSSATYQFIATTLPAMLDYFFGFVPGNPDRIQSFASLSNSVNNVVMERQSGSSFGRERFFIITPDQVMDMAIRDAIDRISIDQDDVFTEPIPSDMRTGLDEHADDFATFMRYAMPDDEVAAGKWRTDLPLVVLRVRDLRLDRARVPYPPVTLDARTAESEAWLSDDLLALAAAVNETWETPCLQPDCSDRAISFIDMQMPPINLVGPFCTEIGMNCLGDTQDTTYMATRNLSLDNGEVYAVAGLLGTATGNATYVGLSVNESTMVKGVKNISTDELENSAAAYSGTVNNTEYLYLYYFARDCSDIEDLTGGNCYSVTEEDVPPGDLCKLVQRMYIHPGTARGADPSLLLPPLLIRLERP